MIILPVYIVNEIGTQCTLSALTFKTKLVYHYHAIQEALDETNENKFPLSLI